MKYICISLCVLCVTCANMLAQNAPEFNCYINDAKSHIREHNCDFQDLQLTLRFAPEQGKLEGSASYIFAPIQQEVDSVFLDGPGILIQNILLDNAAARFKSDSAGITVFFNPPLTWNTTHKLNIQYAATPRKGLYFIGWNKPITAAQNDPNRTRKQIWSQGQGVDNRFWIPGYDDVNDKLTTSLTVTFDKKYTVISNGEPRPVIANADGTNTWSFSMPHPHALYLVMLAIGDYSSVKFTSDNGITSTQYYYPDRQDDAKQTYNYSAQMMDWLQHEIGIDFPWTTYANIPVQDFMYGAMENTTATIYTDYYLQDDHETTDKKYYGVNAHELTHQWFGDYVTEYSSAQHWLHESFATYYSKKFRQSIEGEDVYAWIRRDEMSQAWDADNKDHLPVANGDAGSARYYPKGSIVLDMMRYVVGDEQFRKTIKEYLINHPYQNVETNDLQMQFMMTLGINLDWFFDEWILKGGYPEYTVNYAVEKMKTVVTIKQTQKKDETVKLFKMPIHIQVHYKDGSFDDVLSWIQNAETTVPIVNKNAKQIAFVLFDPGSMIYAKVNFVKNYDELKLQAYNAPQMIDRYDAITAMRKMPLEQKRNDLITLYTKENFYAIKSEIIGQLINDTDKNAVTLIKKAIHDSNENVRRAVITNTTIIPKKLEKDYITLLNDFNYLNAELALRKLCEVNPDSKKQYLSLTKNTAAGKSFRIAWLELANGIDGNMEIQELVNYTGYSYEFRTRTSAMSALKNLNYCDKTTVENLFDAMLSGNGRLRNSAAGTLKYFMETKAYYDIVGQVYNNTNWEDWERQRVSSIFPKK